jgi:hypothetical protein
MGGHTSAVQAVWGDKDIGVHYSGSEDCLLVLWDAESGKKLRSINCYTPVRAMAGDASLGISASSLSLLPC